MRTETLKTKRLTLRRLQAEDARALHENCSSDENVVRYLERGVCADPETTKALVKDWIKRYKTDDFFLWAVEFSGQVIGTVNLHDIDRENRRCEIGFSIGSKWWNQGIVTEAAGAVAGHAFSTLGFECIIGWCAAENAASARVMEKISMKKERFEPNAVRLSGGERADRIWYAMRKEDVQ